MSLKKALKQINPNAFVIDDVFKIVEKERKKRRQEEEEHEEYELRTIQRNLPNMDVIEVGDYDDRTPLNMLAHNTTALIALYNRIVTKPGGPLVFEFIES